MDVWPSRTHKPRRSFLWACSIWGWMYGLRRLCVRSRCFWVSISRWGGARSPHRGGTSPWWWGLSRRPWFSGWCFNFKFMFHEKVCFDFVTKSKSKFVESFKRKVKVNSFWEYMWKFPRSFKSKLSSKFPRSFKIDLISRFIRKFVESFMRKVKVNSFWEYMWKFVESFKRKVKVSWVQSFQEVSRLFWFQSFMNPGVATLQSWPQIIKHYYRLWDYHTRGWYHELVRVTGCSRNYGVATLQSWPANW